MSAPAAGRARLGGLAITVLIALSLAHGLGGSYWPAWPAGLCAWLVAVLLVPTVGRYQRLQTAGMTLAGGAGIAYAAGHGDSGWWPALLDGNQAILAMLATVSFLRVGTRADRHTVLPRGRGAILQTLLAVHLFGAIINISAAFVVGQRISAAGSLTPLQAKVISRAFAAAACWSPLFASMAVVLHYVPQVSIVAVVRVNLVLAALLLAYATWDLGRDRDAADFTGFPLQREALTAPLTLSALVLLLYTQPTGWSILTTIVVAALLCVLVLRIAQPLAVTRRLLRQHIERELPRMGGEFALFIGATVLAAGIAAVVRLHPLALVVDPPNASAAVPLLVALVVITLCGIHPVISVATLSGLFPAHLTAPNVVATVALMAWSVTLATSPFSGTTLALQGRFGISATHFLRWNFRYTLVGLATSSALLVLAGGYGWI